MILAAVLLVVGAGRAAAQEKILDLRLLELSEDGERTYHNLIVSYGVGRRLSFEAFWLFLPQFEHYDELGLGLGVNLLRKRGVSLTLIGYLAAAPDDEYFEPALLAADGDGRVTWSLFVLRYLPLGSAGVEQWLVDPLEVQFRVGGRVSLGASAYLYRPDGGSWLSKVGPKVSVADRWGSSDLALRRVNEGSWELQLRRILVF